MNDTAIKNYATWARRELIAQVQRRCARYGILEKGSPDAKAESIEGRVLTAQERGQRAKLLQLAAADGWQELVERAAYTWFNRLLAIRFMEVNDRLPSHVRVLSAEGGSFRPQALSEAMDLPLDALDRDEAARLVQAGDDEALFRRVFLAQCDELADCMPAVFSHVGGAMELLLPDGLLRSGGVVEQLVTAIPEDDWREGVEIVGWMYQYYVSERKDEVFAGFKKGKKAERGSIAPATQLFTPNWIVRYLTENSLGRLWVLNHPESSLPSEMPYFVKPDEDHETGFRRVSSPEEITVVDPACGSGHILVYAFELLSKMYAEAGYAPRDAARLIVEKNLSGMEIDPRAAAMASFAVTMKACEVDSRFLRRGVAPRITVLERVELQSEELDLCPNLLGRRDLVDAAAHLDECGSLLRPTEDDLSAIEGDLASLAGDGTVFASRAREKLERLRAELEPLARRYDVVVANPPYMGSGSLAKWPSEWVKKQYPDEKSDLCTSFIERGFTLSRADGFSAMVTMQSWMFLGSYEKMRGKILRNHSIASMAHLGTRAFGAIGGEVVSTTATVFGNGATGAAGTYFRLVDMGSEAEKLEGLLEALANPACGWLYQTDASDFNSIPGCPIAYWASSAMRSAFHKGIPLEKVMLFKTGMVTGNNDMFLRLWWEVGSEETLLTAGDNEEAKRSGKRWFPYNKGGEFRRWYGNNDYLIDYENEGYNIFSSAKKDNRAVTNMREELRFKTTVTWSLISSSLPAFRLKERGFLYDKAGLSFYPPSAEDAYYALALCNSSFAIAALMILAPTMNFQLGDIWRIPYYEDRPESQTIIPLARHNVAISQADWDTQETSWGFRRHPLI